MLKASRKLKESHNMLRRECGNLVCALNENPDAFDGLEYDPPKRQYKPVRHHRAIAHISIVGVGLAWLLRIIGH